MNILDKQEKTSWKSHTVKKKKIYVSKSVEFYLHRNLDFSFAKCY